MDDIKAATRRARGYGEDFHVWTVHQAERITRESIFPGACPLPLEQALCPDFLPEAP